jgi:hypothetical protein
MIWLVFILAESLNGTARIFWLVPFLGDRLAHQISFIIGSVLILAIATLFARWLHVSHFYFLLPRVRMTNMLNLWLKLLRPITTLSTPVNITLFNV